MPNNVQEQWLQKLLDYGLLTKEHRDAALKESRSVHRPVLDLLVNRNYVSERDMAIFLSQELNMPVMNPLDFRISREVLDLIPLEFVKRYHMIPISRLDRYLTVATSNPLDLMSWDDLAAITGLKIKPVLTTKGLIEEAIKRFYLIEESGSTKTSEESFADISKDVETVSTFQQLTKTKAVDLAKEVNEAPVIKLTNLLILEAIKRKASDLFIEPWEKYVRVRCRVDGMIEEMKNLPVSMSQTVVSRIKVMSDLDIAEHRIPQDGRFKAKVHHHEIDFRVSVIPTSFGEKVCIRLLDKKSEGHGLEQLGFTETEIKKIREASSKPHGMILVTGPTGSGKTTTLYSMLSYLHTPDKNITTVEDPVEYQVPGINQVNVRESVGLTFTSALRSILRQDPNVIMIGEIRDLETMDIAIKSALTGHLVLSTLHTNDASSSVVRMVNMGIEPFLIVSSVNMVTAQRLVRKLCPKCKEAVQADPESLCVLMQPPSQKVTIYKPHGCSSCRQTGFSGRRVITEVLVLSPSLRNLILKKANADEVKDQARREGMTTLRESGIHKVLAGDTTVEEVLRVTVADRELVSC